MIRSRARPVKVALSIVSAVVIVLAAAALWMWGGRGAHEASVDKAVDRFRRAPVGAGGGFLRPAPGVYTYRGRGTERLSLLSAEQGWGPRVPGTVTAAGPGCWRFRVEYSSNHVQEMDFCARATELTLTGGRIELRFDFGGFAIDETTQFVCKPPGVTVKVRARTGNSWRYSCTGRSGGGSKSIAFTDRYTFLGRRYLSVGGTDVETYAYRVDRTLGGDQSGEEHNELWFAVGNGLPVRVRRDVRVKSSSSIGAVTYTERGMFALASVTPRR